MELLAAFLAISLLLNVLFAVTATSLRKSLKNIESQKKPLTMDAQQLLHDITHGGALVKITPMNPEDLYLRSPKQ